MRFIEKILPNRIDIFTLVCGVLFVLIVCCLWVSWTQEAYGLFYFLSPTLGAVAVCLSAIGATLGWQRCSRRRATILLLFALAGIASAYLVSIRSESSMELTVDRGLMRHAQLSGADIVQFWAGKVWLFPVCFFVSWLVILGIRTLPAMIKSKFQASRTTALVCVAAVLFLIVFVNNLAAKFGWISHNSNVATQLLVTFWAKVFAVFAAFWFLVYFPSRVFTKRSRWWAILFVCFPVLVTSLFFDIQGLEVYVNNMGMMPFEVVWPCVLGVLGAVLWLLSLFGLAMPSLALSQRPSEADGSDLNVGAESPIARPSIWALVFVGVAASVFLIPSFFDTDVLMDEYLAQRRWEAAWDSKRMSKEFDGQVTLSGVQTLWKVNAAYGMQCDFDSSTDPDVFNRLPVESSEKLSIKNLNPTIRTDRIRAMALDVRLDSGEVTIAQLTDLCSNKATVEIGNLTIQPADEKAEIVGWDEILIECEPGKTAVLLNAVTFSKPASPLAFIKVRSTLNLADWRAIIEASQSHRFLIDNGSVFQFEIEASQRCSNIALCDRDLSYVENSQTDAFLKKTNVKIHSQFYNFQEPDQNWDTYFAFPGRALIGKWAMQTANVAETAMLTRRHWAYGVKAPEPTGDGENQITELFLPGTVVIDTKELDSLRVLSFDERWVGITPVDRAVQFKARNLWGTPSNRMNVDWVGDLATLEELYLPSGVEIDDVSFLNSLDLLKHLQIPNSFQFTSRLPVLLNLESVTFFGAPNSNAINDLTAMPKLKKVVFVATSDSGSFNAKLMASLKKSLSKMDIEVVEEKDYVPEISASFKQHLERKEKQLSAEFFENSKSR